MSLTDILLAGNSGLNASQAGMRSVSNNIANAGVSGYARERVSTLTGVSSGRVNGVVVSEPERVADSFLENSVYRKGGDMGRTEVVTDYLDRLQSLLGAVGSAGGLAGVIDAVSASAAAMTGQQGAPAAVAVFTGSIQDSLDTIRQLDDDVDNLRSNVESEFGATVDRINVLLNQIHKLNDDIAGAGGSSLTGAENARTAALEELSGLMKLTVRPQPDGRVMLETSSGQVLLDKRLRQLSYPNSGGAAQPTYPPIDIRLVNDDGTLGASTGDKIESSTVGGKLGGLFDLRDRQLPQFAEQLGVLFNGLSESLNAVSNTGTSVPPPSTLTGRATGLVGTDPHGFTGTAVFAVVAADGTLVRKVPVDFDTLPPGATIDDAVAAINAGLSPDGTATMTDGILSISASGTGNGIVVAQDSADPSKRGGVGFSQFFGLNDIVRSETSALRPSGLLPTDTHGFTAGQSAQIELRDASGKILTSYTLTGSTGPTYADLVTELNASPAGDYGTFSMDDRGRFRFEPDPASAGATISIPADMTNRAGTGMTFGTLSGLTGDTSGLQTANVRADILSNPARAPLAQFNLSAAVGEKALGPGDVRNANAFVDKLQTAVDLGKDGSYTVDRFTAQFLGKTGAEASTARASYDDANARFLDAATRRDNFAGVNVDEELSQMVVLQSSYSAAARIITTASDMYTTLIQMVN